MLLLPEERSHQKRLQKPPTWHEEAKDSGMPFVDRKQTAAITDDEITGAVIDGVPNVASSSHDYVFAVMERSSLETTPTNRRGCSFSWSSLSCKSSVSASRKRCILGPR